ncbi:hypothetical protein FA15DRAFT_662966 [Coprinopsis marcescibilis]|uniref:Conserved oligomeric Golgi complex subunit 1 n=1 Tax=Coprinopsis marcescibilis TaxID=230819 RepID=A0A5C3LDQ2_COPMA|nr:hypothetical protein FA15DRAFT_662966 [Coprinopsis marcescibilis]
MYRPQPSATPAKSASSLYGFASANFMQPSPSLLSTTSSKPTESDALTPDELFTRHTVVEVKVIQQRLRHDAEVKQEELRLMVGERYRDLIQASSSIISMGKSSQQVLTSFEDCKAAILAQQEPPLPSRTTTFGGVNDRHLHTLQTLSAHLKVLLDAPEHLWRFIERKKYLHAAWLFSFIRVVHRGLVKDDEEEESWTKIGIDVPIEFPLVQRQWDEVSSFRSQIIHKATLSLRELSSSVLDICSTLVALHLLDSRPLTETFAALLGQRTKALSPLLSWRVEHKAPTVANGHPPGQKPTKTSKLRSHLSKEILHANQRVLNTIIKTINTSREIFEIQGNRKSSLITLLLKAVQSDSENFELSKDLELSTHALLINSTSSAHFLLLPSNLQSYRPYVDLTSASTSYSPVEFQQALQKWVAKASKSWQDASDNWFTNLLSVAEIWDVRSALRNAIQTSTLEAAQKEELNKIVDYVSRSRILSVWSTTLSNGLASFKKEVFVFLSKPQLVSSAETLFRTPPPPSVSSQGAKAADTKPFRQYQAALKQHLLNRTGQVDTVLASLEQCARSIQKDLSIVFSDTSEDGKSFAEVLVDGYQPHAETIVDDVALALEETVESSLTNSDINNLVGLANVSDDLGSSSIFITHIGCRRNITQKFRSRIDHAYDRVVQEWRSRTIDRVVEVFSDMGTQPLASQVAGPSPRLLQSLLELSGALRELGVRQHHIRHQPIIQGTLKLFIERHLSDESHPPQPHDILFLKAIAGTYGPDWDEFTTKLTDKLKEQAALPDLAEAEGIASEHLSRTQTLLSTLLPCFSQIQVSISGTGPSAQGQFLLFTAPSSKQEYQSALEVAKPSPRFGLLLVSSAAENP